MSAKHLLPLRLGVFYMVPELQCETLEVSLREEAISSPICFLLQSQNTQMSEE